MISSIGIRAGQSLLQGVQVPAANVAPVGKPTEMDGGSFGNMMSAMFKDAVGTMQAGEAASIAGMQGKVPLQQVVEAVMLAEQSLHTAVVVRDKVVGAYLEISRMQI